LEIFNDIAVTSILIIILANQGITGITPTVFTPLL